MLNFEGRCCLQSGSAVDLHPELGFNTKEGGDISTHAASPIHASLKERQEDIISTLTKQQKNMSQCLGIQHRWAEGWCSLTLSPGAELPLLCGPGKYNRLEKTEKTVVKV